MDSFCPLKCDFIGSQVQHTQSIILQAELLDSINGVAVELILPERQFFEATINLKHFGKVDGALLPDAFVLRGIQA